MDNPQGNVFMEKYLTPLAVLLAAVIIALALIFGTGVNKTGPKADNGIQSTADIAQVATNGPFIGEANAPTAIAVYEDYQCPFCKQFDEKVMPKIIENYVATGKTKIYIKDFQFLGEDSMTAALFSRALWEVSPEKYYDWYKAVMSAQDEEGDKGFGDLASIKAVSANISGIDVAKVEKVMNEKKTEFETAIAADRAEGSSMGINGTPSIIVGKKLLTGMSPDQFYMSISQDLDAQL
jgi:protein-disulfide isomerase